MVSGQRVRNGFMGDVLASKGERDRSHIAMHDKAEVRRWLRHFGVTKSELQRAAEKVVIQCRRPETNRHRWQDGAASIACSLQTT